MKSLLSIIALLGCSSLFAQETELKALLRIDEAIANTEELRVRVSDGTDTVLYFVVNDLTVGALDRQTVIDSQQKNFTVVFESLTGGQWKQTSYAFASDGREKRIELVLDFDKNETNIEFLQDLTVSKLYASHNVELSAAWDTASGMQPVYNIVNNSDTIFYSQTDANGFYGKILYNAEEVWTQISGSHVDGKLPDSPLKKGEAVVSYAPSYNPGYQFVVTQPGEYKYVVLLGLDKTDPGFSASAVQQGKTRKRVVRYCELETNFEIK